MLELEEEEFRYYIANCKTCKEVKPIVIFATEASSNDVSDELIEITEDALVDNGPHLCICVECKTSFEETMDNVQELESIHLGTIGYNEDDLQFMIGETVQLFLSELEFSEEFDEDELETEVWI